MGLAIFAFVVAGSLAVLAGVGVYRVCKWLGRPDIGSNGGALTGLVWFAVLGPPIHLGVMWLTTTQELGLSGDKADAVLEFLQIPHGTATDVCYRQSYLGFNADFAMSEEDFLAWMKCQSWTTKRFTIRQEWEKIPWRKNGERIWVGNGVVPVRLLERDQREIFVRDGYCHYDPNTRPECSWKIIYDRASHRVYVDN